MLNELAKMKPLRTPAREVYEAIPVVYRDQDEFDISGTVKDWMDKGMQIYSSIDAPVEIKDVFPLQQETNFLSDDLIKLLENKEK